jgi:hypothetical protein
MQQKEHMQVMLLSFNSDGFTCGDGNQLMEIVKHTHHGTG